MIETDKNISSALPQLSRPFVGYRDAIPESPSRGGRSRVQRAESEPERSKAGLVNQTNGATDSRIRDASAAAEALGAAKAAIRMQAGVSILAQAAGLTDTAVALTGEA